MRPGNARRLASLEQQAPSKVRATFADPVTGEEVEIGDLMMWSTYDDLGVAMALHMAKIGELDTMSKHREEHTPSGALAAIRSATPDQIEAWWRDLLALWFDRRRRKPKWWDWKDDEGVAAERSSSWPIPSIGAR